MNLKTIPSLLLAAVLLPLPAFAEQDIEALVASKRAVEMSYRELMHIMGNSLNLMQTGLVSQNKELVEQGANIIFTHPAPKEKPWKIMRQEDQDAFKKVLLSYDKVLDDRTKDILSASRQKDWVAASESLAQLQYACVSCHMQWKHKAQP